jgi:hypothetical protein
MGIRGFYYGVKCQAVGPRRGFGWTTPAFRQGLLAVGASLLGPDMWGKLKV